MNSIEDYNIDFFIPSTNQKEYLEIVNSNTPLEQKIVKLLTINPGFMKKMSIITEEEKYKKFKERGSINLIKEKINKNKKLEFFALSFNVKPHIKEITNGLIYPDASDFLTLLHLNLVFKHINNIYKPGANLRIGTQFMYFRKFNHISEAEATEMQNTVELFNDVAERLTSSKDVIRIFDIYNSVEPIKKEFYLKVEKAKFDIIQNDNDMSEIKKGADYYMNFVVDISHFPNKEAAWNFCMYHTLDSAAYKSAVLSMFPTQSGIFERFDELIQVETRFQTGSNLRENIKSIFISFLPGATTFSFNRLTLKNKEKLAFWELTTYKEAAILRAKEVFVKEFAHPFFFEEVSSHSKGS